MYDTKWWAANEGQKAMGRKGMSSGSEENGQRRVFWRTSLATKWLQELSHWKPVHVSLHFFTPTGEKYFLVVREGSWSSSKTSCETRNAHMVQIPDDMTNSMVQTETKGEKVWIGLSRPNYWYWFGSGKTSTFQNWQHGQPDNMNQKESCAAMVMKDGTWTDELCSAKYPVFCYRGMKQWVLPRYKELFRHWTLTCLSFLGDVSSQ